MKRRKQSGAENSSEERQKKLKKVKFGGNLIWQMGKN